MGLAQAFLGIHEVDLNNKKYQYLRNPPCSRGITLPQGLKAHAYGSYGRLLPRTPDLRYVDVLAAIASWIPTSTFLLMSMSGPRAGSSIIRAIWPQANPRRLAPRLSQIRQGSTTSSTPFLPCPACFPVLHQPARVGAHSVVTSGLVRWASPLRVSYLPARTIPTKRYLSSTPLRPHADRASPPTNHTPPHTAKTLTEEEKHVLSSAAGKATQPHSSVEGAVVPSATSDAAKSAELEITEKEQSRRDWEIIKKLIPNIWPKDDWGTKTRVLVAVGLLVGGKVSQRPVDYFQIS